MDFPLVAVHRLLNAASLVVELRLWGAQSSVVAVHRLSFPAACGILSGMEPMSPALTAGFFTTGPPRKPSHVLVDKNNIFQSPFKFLSGIVEYIIFLPILVLLECRSSL